MRFRFIRIGGRGPVDESASKLDLCECFAACTQDVKDKLIAFLDSKEEMIRFEFDGQTVKVRKE
jgi:hypothetical protein